MISLTIFTSIYDNKTGQRRDFTSFTRFKTFLYHLSRVEFTKKEDAKLISPATYLSNSLRRNVNVVDWGGWACLDIDDWKLKGNLRDDMIAHFGTHNFLCYSTASSTYSTPKFRLVFETSKRVPVKSIKKFWFALNTEYGQQGDKQVKDYSRMYYVPGTYRTRSDSNCFIFTHNSGKIIDPDQLIEKYPIPKEVTGNSFFDKLPENIQEQIIEHRKSSLDNTTFSWNSYHECPFFPKKLSTEYLMIVDTGWYYKMYQIMIAIAGKAVDKKYPITAKEIANMCYQFDLENGGWYADRPMEKEADRALEYVYRNM